MVKLSGFFKNVSIIMLTVILLVVYAFLRENVVGVLFNGKVEVLFSISRNQFFYFILCLCVAYHIVFHLFKIGYLSAKSSSDEGKSSPEYKNTFLTWWNFVVLSVNLFFISFLIFAGLANNAVDFNFSSITFIPITGVIPLMLSILALPLLYFNGLYNKNRVSQKGRS